VNEVATQDKIYEIQDLIKEMPQADVITRHHFSDGMYAREMVMPAGCIVVGALHKTKHLFSVVSGECEVSSVHEREKITAPYLGETIPGTKRVIYSEAGCTWITFHPTHLTDIDEIEAAIIEPEVI
tara:strand:+ start:179 stop:556 length:378 start_codon:yes stop_codon:yes gene_type:complete